MGRSFGVLCALWVLLLAGSASAAAPGVEVVGGRADLIAGGEALVRITGDRTGLRVTLDGRDVTQAFGADGTGVLTGIPEGTSLLRATSRGGGASLELRNHPSSGPLFSGPRKEPWTCLVGKPEDGCSADTTYRFYYKPVGSPVLDPYDPGSPPPAGRIDRATTDGGDTVPFIVRVEEGTLDRAIYHVAVLVEDPAKPFTPREPHKTWNRKLLIHLGGGSAFHHVQRAPAPPDSRSSSYNAFDRVGEIHALARGFIVATTGFSATSRVHDEVLTTEAVAMLKQRIAARYGAMRHTIGAGCSGGSIQQHVGASAYPGLYDGIQPSCSFPDSVTVLRMVADCHLLLDYFDRKSPHLWPDSSQQAAVSGYRDMSNCNAWEALFANLMDPSARNCASPGTQPHCSVGGISNARSGNPCGLPNTDLYSPSRPDGIRCSVWDYMKQVWGPRPPEAWTDIEQQLGRGFAARPFDNVGVQYGLRALEARRISPEQFVDLNARIGGLSIDFDFQPERMVADPSAIEHAYRSGQVMDPGPMKDLPILDLRGYSESGDVHTTHYTYVTRARLEARNGDSANQVVWTFPALSPPLPIPGPDMRAKSLDYMDRWLEAVAADGAPGTRAEKVRRNRPDEGRERCFAAGPLVAPGAAEVDSDVCQNLQPNDEPRIVAGEPRRLDVLKCRLEPLDKADYPVLFTHAQWERLEEAFPNGVCDYSEPPVGFRSVEPWQTYNDERGQPIPGGRGLGPAPRSAPDRLGLAAARRCVSRRNFRIRLRAPRGERLRSARVTVNGKRVAVRRGKRLSAPVDLRGLPKGRVRVKVVAVTRSGRRITETRTYRTCTPKRRKR